MTQPIRDLADIKEEIECLIKAGKEQLDDIQIAQEYFSDAGSVLYTIDEKELRESIASEMDTKFGINPLDYAY